MNIISYKYVYYILFMQIASIPHADFRYDYDDPLFHQAVIILYKDKNDLKVEL